MMYDELIEELRRHHCDAKEDDTQEVCEECAYDVIIADKSVPSGIASVCVYGLMNRAADAIEELSMKLHGDEAAIDGMKREIERMVVADKPRWIPVTEKQPKNGSHCLVARYDYVTNTPFVDLLWFDNSWWDRLNSGDYNVTHWMPLPEPPKEET